MILRRDRRGPIDRTSLNIVVLIPAKGRGDAHNQVRRGASRVGLGCMRTLTADFQIVALYILVAQPSLTISGACIGSKPVR
jgi:hypothetical protein